MKIGTRSEKMIMEIIVGIIGLAFVVLVIFLILTLQTSRKTMKKADRVLSDLHKTMEGVSESSLDLIHNANKLTLDIRKKSEALDILFRPLYLIKREKTEEKDREKTSEIIECVLDAVHLFSKIKDGIKGYVKSR
jgi:uncharacterized protein DUF948